MRTEWSLSHYQHCQMALDKKKKKKATGWSHCPHNVGIMVSLLEEAGRGWGWGRHGAYVEKRCGANIPSEAEELPQSRVSTHRADRTFKWILMS